MLYNGNRFCAFLRIKTAKNGGRQNMRLTILLVDDDQLLTNKTKNSLNWEQLGIGMVFTANNIHEAKGILKVYKVDILLCDVDMPMGSGLELVEWIREEGMEIKCIFLSSYANFTYAQKALRLGSVNYLLKPISNKDLEAELKTVCDELLKEHTNLNSQEKKQREEVWKKVVVQALSDGVGTSNTRSLSDTQYSELYPSVQPITLVLTGLLDNSDERQKVKDISLYNYCMRTVSEKYLRELDLDVIVSYKDAEWLIVLKNFADYDRLEEQLSKMQQELNEQTAHSYCFYITTGRPYASIAKSIRIISDMREHAIPNKRLMIEEWAWELRKISYSEPSWEKWQEMFHKNTASGDSSYNTAYMDVMHEMLTYVDHACESGNWYLSDLKRFVKHMGDLLVKVLRDNNETFEELFDWQEYERMSFLARRSEQGCIDLIETVWKKMDSLHKTEDKAEATIAKLKKYIEENLGGELTRSVLAGQVYLSEDYITRLFIRETGQTLPVYIARRRMEKAAKLLRESTDPISKIVMEVGYSNFSYFSKTFRDYVGSTPNEYRAKYRK